MAVTIRNHTITASLELVTEECCNCGITFAVPKDFRKQCVDHPGPNGKQFYCPNGHGQHYTGPTEAQKQKERAERLARRVEYAEAEAVHLRDQRDAAERSNRALKGVVTKTKRRVGNGVCPCCNRTFKDLARHMSGQHPDYATDPTS